jgi:16S rRNA processing protein RimM
MPDRITLAAVAGAHGIAGEVRLKLFAQGVDSLARHKDVTIGDRAFALTSVRAGGQGRSPGWPACRRVKRRKRYAGGC